MKSAARRSLGSAAGAGPYDVAIVGAGVMGLTVAHQLHRRDPGLKLLVLDRFNGVGNGSTGYSSAILRNYYSNPEMIDIASTGQWAYQHWNDFLGLRAEETVAEYTRTGDLFNLGVPKEVYELQKRQLAEFGLEADVLDKEELRERFPWVNPSTTPIDDLLEGAEDNEGEGAHYLYEPEAGYFNPNGALEDLLTASRRAGTALRFNAPVRRFATRGGRCVGVELADGETIEAGAVVNCSGPWCNPLFAEAGIEFPLTLKATRIQVLYKKVDQAFADRAPVVSDGPGGIYIKPQRASGQLVISSLDAKYEQERVEDPDDFNTAIDPDFREAYLMALHHRVPDLPTSGAVTGFSTLYTVCVEDSHPIVGPTEMEGLYVMNGFSGHGFKEAPSWSSMVAQHLTGATLGGGRKEDFECAVDIGFCSPYRKPLTRHEGTPAVLG